MQTFLNIKFTLDSSFSSKIHVAEWGEKRKGSCSQFYNFRSCWAWIIRVEWYGNIHFIAVLYWGEATCCLALFLREHVEWKNLHKLCCHHDSMYVYVWSFIIIYMSEHMKRSTLAYECKIKQTIAIKLPHENKIDE